MMKLMKVSTIGWVGIDELARAEQEQLFQHCQVLFLYNKAGA
jgi:hypothetical protein